MLDPTTTRFGRKRTLAVVQRSGVGGVRAERPSPRRGDKAAGPRSAPAFAAHVTFLAVSVFAATVATGLAWPAIRSAAKSFAANQNCTIKGNLSEHGEIYHVHGDEHYAETRIDTSRGERWFCSEAEAREAGWRRAKR